MPNLTTSVITAVTQGAEVKQIKKVGYLVLWEKPKRRRRRTAKTAEKK